MAIIAISIRLVWTVLIIDREPQFDEVHYIGQAERLVQGEGYVDPQGKPTAYWPVGYPAALALAYTLFGQSAWTAAALQIMLSAATCLLLSMLGERLLGRRIGRTAGLVLALYPNHVMYSTLYLSEPLTALMLLGAIGCFLLPRRAPGLGAFSGGALLGVATLARTEFLCSAPLLLFWYRSVGHKWGGAVRLTALVCGGTLLVAGPWILRGAQLARTPGGVAGKAGLAFLVGNHPTALGGYALSGSLMHRLEIPDGTPMSEQLALGLQLVKNAPFAALRRVPQKITYFLALETDGTLWNFKGLPTRPPPAVTWSLLAITNLAYLGVVAGATLGLLTAGRCRPLAGLVGLFGAYLVTITLVFFGDPRYHFVLIPPLALFLAKAVWEDLPALREGFVESDPDIRRRLITWGVLMSGFAGALTMNLWLKWLEKVRYGVGW